MEREKGGSIMKLSPSYGQEDKKWSVEVCIDELRVQIILMTKDGKAQVSMAATEASTLSHMIDEVVKEQKKR
jgi:hypothetical protein